MVDEPSQPAATHKVTLDLDDSDYTERAIAHPQDIGTSAGFRVGTLRELQRMSDELGRMSTDIEQLNDLIDRYRSPLYSLQGRDIVVIEVFLSLASIWAAFTLWHTPSLFETFPGSFHLIEAFEDNEADWGIFAGLSAILKISGLVTGLGGNQTWGRLLRYLGLSMSGVFWSLMGGGVLLSNPHTLFGFNSLLMGLFSWWSLLRLAK